MTLAAGAALALALAACNRADDTVANIDNAAANDVLANDMMANDMMANDMNAAAANAGAVAPMAAAAFANTVAASDAFEIESGKLAAEKGTAKAVKDFGTMMQTDHKKSTADLKTAAGKAEPAITPASTLTAEQQGNLDKLKAASGADFDRMYAEQQVAAHQKALDALQTYAAGGDAASLREFAAKAVNVVQGHLEKARALPR